MKKVVVELIRKFASTAINDQVVIRRTHECWAMDVWDRHPRLTLPEDVLQNDEQDKLFRKDFIERFPSGRGFANITISILHELGHWATQDQVDWEAYYEEIKPLHGLDYFHCHGEMVATNWAIEWLKDPEHRKIAKQFECNIFKALK